MSLSGSVGSLGSCCVKYSAVILLKSIQLILVCIAILLLLLIVWFVYRNARNCLWSRINVLPYTVEEDTIYGVDFPGGIAEALSRQNYREAVRLLYLQTLKQLSDAERIDWQLYKTPTQYINEVRLPAFRQLTNHFLRVRYGNFKATEELFRVMQTLQGEIGKGASHERKSLVHCLYCRFSIHHVCNRISFAEEFCVEAHFRTS